MSAPPDDKYEAMSPRAIITQAVELLQAQHSVTEAVAFRMLVQGSVESHEKVRHVAAAIVRELQPEQ
jgi:AmiR/NasT family two-component response regulator